MIHLAMIELPVSESLVKSCPTSICEPEFTCRCSAWGFLASREVQQAGDGNAGLVDRKQVAS